MSRRCLLFVILSVWLFCFVKSSTIVERKPAETPLTSDAPLSNENSTTLQPRTGMSSTPAHNELSISITDFADSSTEPEPSTIAQGGFSTSLETEELFQTSLPGELNVSSNSSVSPMGVSIVNEEITPTTESARLPNFANFMDNNINFTLSLYNSISSAKDSENNIFFSPLSIFTALLMLHYGARGVTAEELANVLDINTLSADIDVIHEIYGNILDSLSDDETSKSYILMANKMFIASGFEILDKYQKGINEFYNASAQPVDFFEPHTTHLINAWVKSKTKGHIPNLFKVVLPPSTAAVMLNALYFKGDWQYDFSPADTVENAKFLLHSEAVTNVSMMVNKVKLAHGNSLELKASILELPYVGDRLSMFAILPKGDTTLDQVEEKLNIESLKKLLRGMKRRVVNVRLPKFQLRDAAPIMESLKELGVRNLFSGQANLSGLAEGGLLLSDIKHEATIEVNESGSVASAATGVILERLGSSYEQHFEADRPFVFFIIDKQNGLILFMGRVANPST